MKKGKILAALLVTFASSTAMAGSATSNFQASAVLEGSCTLTATNVDFGTINQSEATNGTGTITYICSKSVPYYVTINAGSYGSVAARKMAGAVAGNTDKLAYNLYADAATQIIVSGNRYGGDGGFSYSGDGTGKVETITVYGKVESGQYIKPDTYADNLTVSVYY
ncbi:Csu type fimbrial protein [Janthinobacterium sp. PSPC2-1]|uniref:Csu type fimbrial protein n=1 Tax=unclassified Janthinobacterium TaxID=2610881 RepID=UPI003CF407AB